MPGRVQFALVTLQISHHKYQNIDYFCLFYDFFFPTKCFVSATKCFIFEGSFCMPVHHQPRAPEGEDEELNSAQLPDEQRSQAQNNHRLTAGQGGLGSGGGPESRYLHKCLPLCSSP